MYSSFFFPFFFLHGIYLLIRNQTKKKVHQSLDSLLSLDGLENTVLQIAQHWEFRHGLFALNIFLLKLLRTYTIIDRTFVQYYAMLY